DRRAFPFWMTAAGLELCGRQEIVRLGNPKQLPDLQAKVKVFSDSMESKIQGIRKWSDDRINGPWNDGWNYPTGRPVPEYMKHYNDQGEFDYVYPLWHYTFRNEGGENNYLPELWMGHRFTGGHPDGRKEAVRVMNLRLDTEWQKYAGGMVQPARDSMVK